jgi:hypothetical protein
MLSNHGNMMWHHVRVFLRYQASFVLLFIGKYLSSLRKLDHIIAPKEGFEPQL